MQPSQPPPEEKFEEKIPVRRLDYRLEQLDNELLLYHPSRTQILYLNHTASLIWELCDGTRTVGEIAALLAVAYPDSADTILGDVGATLQQFLHHACIELV